MINTGIYKTHINDVDLSIPRWNLKNRMIASDNEKL